jgi:hypothetical protein
MDIPSPPVTIANLRAHGVRQLLVYCRGKREGDWPCHHQNELAIDRFKAEEALRDIERRCRCTACGWRRADLSPDYSRQQAALYGGGWIYAARMIRPGSSSRAPEACQRPT